MTEVVNSGSLEDIKKINEIPDNAEILVLKDVIETENSELKGVPHIPPPLDITGISPDDMKSQIKTLSEFDDFAEVLHTLPFITNEHIEEFGWEDFIKEDSQMKKDYVKYKFNKKKNQLKNNRSKK